MAEVFFSTLSEHLKDIKVPCDSDKIYKEECVFSFDTPETETGLYVCLNTFLGFGREHVEHHYRRTRKAVYLHVKREKTEIKCSTVSGDAPEKKVTRLAIGVEGGFDPDAGNKFETREILSVVILPQFLSLAWPNNDLPLLVQQSVQAVLDSESATKLAELEALAGTWDGEVRQVSKHAEDLLQLDNGKKIPPSGWQCESCDLNTNLWLNLTDGSIQCGRKFYDGTGGNDHAVQHYRETGYPLAVKLGTITKDGKGDVWSYVEDDMVENPNLVKHLAHWGINASVLEKTDKSMIEMELECNQRLGEWSALQESNSELRPMYGPGYTGLINLGNTCYFNSVMQVIFYVQDFVARYVEPASNIFDNAPSNPATDFHVQLAKLGCGLLSGKYSQPPPEDARDKCSKGVSPHMFKNLLCRGHQDFSTKHQQDAQEFFLYFITTLQRHCRVAGPDPSECFKFQVEDRFVCGASGKVKVSHRTEYCLPLPIPLEAAENHAEVHEWQQRRQQAETSGLRLYNNISEIIVWLLKYLPQITCVKTDSDPNDEVRLRLKLSNCLEAVFSKEETVEQFFSTALNAKTTAKKTTKLATFPDYLLLHLKKFTMREDWTPIKLDVAVDMPDTIDLTQYRGKGLQAGEEPMPELQGDPPPVALDQGVVNALTDMGFPPESAKKAVYFTGNQGLEPATNWIMEHIGDSDFADPFVPPGTDKNDSQGFVANEESLGMIMNMGFNRAQALKALKATGNNVERALDWIFSHAAELDNPSTESPPPPPEFRDGNGLYKLVAFISHMGSSTMVGHYVCHILRDNRWVIYNDEKVALSENPPRQLGYLYLYQRVK